MLEREIPEALITASKSIVNNELVTLVGTQLYLILDGLKEPTPPGIDFSMNSIVEDTIYDITTGEKPYTDLSGIIQRELTNNIVSSLFTQYDINTNRLILETPPPGYDTLYQGKRVKSYDGRKTKKTSYTFDDLSGNFFIVTEIGEPLTLNTLHSTITVEESSQGLFTITAAEIDDNNKGFTVNRRKHDTFIYDGLTIELGSAAGTAEDTGASSTICFVAGTPIRTDQGEINIEKIDKSTV